MALDRTGTIVALTDGIGVHFGKAARRSFFQQLERLEEQQAFRRSLIEEQRFFVDLLAVASFYQSVIIPIKSSAEFVSVLRSAGATHLRVAGDKLGMKYARRALTVAGTFHNLISHAEIPERLLTYSTLKQFVRSAHDLMERNR